MSSKSSSTQYIFESHANGIQIRLFDQCLWYDAKRSRERTEEEEIEVGFAVVTLLLKSLAQASALYL
jgi:hypothetical protein